MLAKSQMLPTKNIQIPTFQPSNRSHDLPMEAPVIVVEPGLYLGFSVGTTGIWSNTGEGMKIVVFESCGPKT